MIYIKQMAIIPHYDVIPLHCMPLIEILVYLNKLDLRIAEHVVTLLESLVTNHSSRLVPRQFPWLLYHDGI
jgi:hypothetical protein